MRLFSISCLVAAAVAVPSLAIAGGGKPLPGDQHAPPVFQDQTGIRVQFYPREKGYGIHQHVRVYGITSKTDLLRVEWKTGGKVFATVKCQITADPDTHIAAGSCDSDGPFTGKGAVEADIIYTDDKAEKDYLVQTLKLTVKTWTEPDKSTLYQVVPDDVLAVTYVRQDPDTSPYSHHPQFVFWVANGDIIGDITLRCTVDGKKLEDFDTMSGESMGGGELEADHTGKQNHETYKWQQISIEPKAVLFGDKAAIQKKATSSGPDLSTFLQDHPGKWDCNMRIGGKTMREFLFTVDAKGMVLGDELNTGKGALPLPPDQVMIEMRIPKDTGGFDQRLRPDAMKKSLGWGVPWPENAKVKAVQAAFPPAGGSLPEIK